MSYLTTPKFTVVVAFLLASLGLVSAGMQSEGTWPIIVGPDSYALLPGESTNVKITMNATRSAATTVNLSSSNTGLLTVPATVTVPANASTATFTATAVGPNQNLKRSSVVVTATANSHSANATITIDN